MLGVWWLARPGTSVSGLYRSAPVDHGPITKLVTATGTLNAVISVDIGAQVTGLVSELHADFNSEVKAGQVLAVIDPMPYQAALKAAQAQLELAKQPSLSARPISRARSQPAIRQARSRPRTVTHPTRL